MTIFVYIRSMTNTSMNTVKMMEKMVVSSPSESGLTKFGRTPGGGWAAGTCQGFILERSKELRSIFDEIEECE
jgi:hypothetical protein